MCLTAQKMQPSCSSRESTKGGVAKSLSTLTQRGEDSRSFKNHMEHSRIRPGDVDSFLTAWNHLKTHHPTLSHYIKSLLSVRVFHLLRILPLLEPALHELFTVNFFPQKMKLVFHLFILWQ